MAERIPIKSQTYDEYGSPGYEFSLAKEEAYTGHEFVPPKDTDYVNQKSKAVKRFIQRHGVMIMQTAAVCLAVVIVKDAFGYDVLAKDPFNDVFENHHMEYVIEDSTDDAVEETVVDKKEPVVSEPVKPAEKTEPITLDGPDDAFPTLTNLEPNGYVPGYGVLDEQYVMMEYSDKAPDYIYRTARVFKMDSAGLHLEDGSVIKDYYYNPNGSYYDQYDYDKYTSMSWWEGSGIVAYTPTSFLADGSVPQPEMDKVIENKSIPGASYDEATNTLTLNNYTGEFLNVNLMGNGFKLKLVGDNELTGIVVWGFMYGGSLTITGDGKLTLNGSGGTPAIRLECENSPSCLMIDSNVTIEIKGGSGNVAVIDSTLDKGIYYLKPLEVIGTQEDNLIRYLDTSKHHRTWQFRNTAEGIPYVLTIAPKEEE